MTMRKEIYARPEIGTGPAGEPVITLPTERARQFIQFVGPRWQELTVVFGGAETQIHFPTWSRQEAAAFVNDWSIRQP